METTNTLTDNSLAQVNHIMSEIQKLDAKEKLRLYQGLRDEIRRLEDIKKRVLKYRGIAKGIWDMYAQEYINQLRDNDRL